MILYCCLCRVCMTRRIVWMGLGSAATMLMQILVGCSSAPFDGAAFAADAGTPLATEPSNSAPALPSVPWVAPRSSTGGSSTGGSSTGGSSTGGSSTGGSSTGGSSEAGADAAPPLPAGYLAHREHLESSGYTCPALEQAVADCCNSPAAVFACGGDGCKCGARGYGAMQSLCSIAPVTPLQWVCP